MILIIIVQPNEQTYVAIHYTAKKFKSVRHFLSMSFLQSLEILLSIARNQTKWQVTLGSCGGIGGVGCVCVCVCVCVCGRARIVIMCWMRVSCRSESNTRCPCSRGRQWYRSDTVRKQRLGWGVEASVGLQVKLLGQWRLRLVRRYCCMDWNQTILDLS